MSGVPLARLLGGVAAVAAAIPLAACTGVSPAPHPSTGRSHSVEVVVPTSIPNDPALRHDVAMSSCDPAEAGWSAGGRVVNPSGQGRDYRITVLFTSSEATVIGAGRTTVHVDAKGRSTWRVRAKLAPASPTLCVLSGVA